MRHHLTAVLAALTLSLCACTPATPTPSPPGPVLGGASSYPYALRDDVIYFAMTDRFANGSAANDNGPNRNAGDRADPSNPLAWHGGDFAGLKAKIEEGYFGRMGFTALWISPVVLQVPAIAGPSSGPNAGQVFAGYHGYWAENLRLVDPHFGTLSEYQALVTAAHAHGLKVIQDIVVNHLGYNASLAQTQPGWFHTDAECSAASNKTTDCSLFGLPDFKQEVPEVSAYLNDFVTYWRAVSGIDGLRIDTMKHVPDSYWQPFFAAGGAGDPAKVWSVGEVFETSPDTLAHFLNLGAPSVFDFALQAALRDNLSSARGHLDAVADVFAQDGVYSDPTRLTTFIDNHDVRRFVNEVTARGGSDQEAAERLDAALSILFFTRGTPSVYQGTEMAQRGEGDPYNYTTPDSNRQDMNFAALATSTLDERLAALAQARRKYRALTRGTQQELWRPGGSKAVLAYRRMVSGVSGEAGQPVVYVVNGSDATIDLSTLAGGGIPLLGTFGGTALTEITGRASTLAISSDDKLIGLLPPRSVLAVTAPGK